MNPNRYLALLLPLFVASCTSSKVWYRPGVTADQVESDVAHCRFEARRSPAGSPTLVGDRAPISARRFRFLKNPGKASLHGQAFMKTRGGDVKLGAGSTVILIPTTPYTTEIFERVIVGGESIEPPDSRLAEHLKTTIANAAGELEFSSIALGDYYLVCEISWEYGSPQGMLKTGGVAFAKARAEERPRAPTIVTR
jgi:hypothetical protein